MRRRGPIASIDEVQQGPLERAGARVARGRIVGQALLDDRDEVGGQVGPAIAQRRPATTAMKLDQLLERGRLDWIAQAHEPVEQNAEPMSNRA